MPLASRTIASFSTRPLVLVEAEDLAGIAVAAALGDGGDDRARRLLVLGLEVLGQDLELLDGVLRERIAAARVLADDAAVDDVVLEADAVDEDVDVLRRQRAGRELLAELVVGTRTPGASAAKLRKLVLEVAHLLLRSGVISTCGFDQPGVPR